MYACLYYVSCVLVCIRMALNEDKFIHNAISAPDRIKRKLRSVEVDTDVKTKLLQGYKQEFIALHVLKCVFALYYLLA